MVTKHLPIRGIQHGSWLRLPAHRLNNPASMTCGTPPPSQDHICPGSRKLKFLLSRHEAHGRVRDHQLGDDVLLLPLARAAHLLPKRHDVPPNYRECQAEHLSDFRCWPPGVFSVPLDVSNVHVGVGHKGPQRQYRTFLVYAVHVKRKMQKEKQQKVAS